MLSLENNHGRFQSEFLLWLESTFFAQLLQLLHNCYSCYTTVTAVTQLLQELLQLLHNCCNCYNNFYTTGSTVTELLQQLLRNCCNKFEIVIRDQPKAKFKPKYQNLGLAWAGTETENLVFRSITNHNYNIITSCFTRKMDFYFRFDF